MNLFLVISFIVLVIAFIIYAYYSSLFDSPIITRGPFQELYVAYITNKGDYKEAWNHYHEICAIINNRGCSKDACSLPSIGLYYDNPQNVTDKAQLRSSIGIIVDEDWFNSNVNKQINDKLRFGKINALKDSLQVRFPQRSMLGIFTALKKVYPQIFKYLEDHNVKNNEMTEIAEIYNFEKGKMIFLLGLGTREENDFMTTIPETYDFKS